MQNKTRSILEELTAVNKTQDKENLVLSRASHIIDSSINLFGFIRENFDQETAYKYRNEILPISEDLRDNSIIIPLFNGLSHADIKTIVKALKELLI